MSSSTQPVEMMCLDYGQTSRKRLMNENLQILFKTSEFKLATAHLPASWKFIQISNSHKKEVVNILCYAFSLLSNAIADKILKTEVFDTYKKYDEEITKAIENGIGIVCLNEYFEVIMVYYRNDIGNLPKKILSNTLKRRYEIWSSVTNHLMKNIDNELQLDIIHCKNNNICGNYIMGGGLAIKPEYKQMGWYKISRILHAALSSVGYKGGFGNYNNIRTQTPTLHSSQSHKWIYPGSFVNLYNYKFEDGSMLDEEYFKQNNCNHLKDNARIIGIYQDFKKARYLLKIDNKNVYDHIKIFKALIGDYKPPSKL